MSELLVTQCPYCQTRFRLSQQHLAAAAGNVRCGACLKVFNASLAPPPASPSPSTEPPGIQPAQDQDQPSRPSPTPVIAPRQGTLLIHDDLDFDELDLEALGLDESVLDEINPRQTPEQLADRPQKPFAEPDAEPESSEEPTPAAEAVFGPEPSQLDEVEPDADAGPAAPVESAELLADAAPLRDMDAEFELKLDPEADAAEPAAADPLQDLHEDFIASPVQDFGPAARPEEDAQQADTEDSDEPAGRFGLPRTGSPLRPLAEDPASRSPQGIYLRDRPEYVTPKLAWHEPSEEPAEPPPAPAAPSEPAARAAVGKLFRSEPELEPEPEPELGELDLSELRDDPVVFEEPPRAPARRRQTWLWGALSVVAAVALLVQYVNYNFTALAHDQRTRPALATACLLAGCELPPRVDISLLRSSNLLVRTHPEFPNALAIDVILYNRADFVQPFPVLRMSFTDSHGREVASRRFRPEEYLSGELAGAQLMPLQTPIHVGLSMLNPGEEAVSYRLDFLSP